MTIQLTRIQVHRLHGHRSYDIPIEDNKLIVVGENGTGKSTIITMLYLFLTKQWIQLLNHDFQSISITINGENLSLKRSDIEPPATSKQKVEPVSSRILRNTIIRVLKRDPPEHIPDALAGVAEFLEEDLTTVMQLAEELKLEIVGKTKLATLDSKLKNIVKEQVLFLPTYRRIERDLESIFPQLEIENRSRRFPITRNPRMNEYKELVEFGMEDVEGLITQKMSELKDAAQNDLNALTGKYLRDVLQGVHHHTNQELIQALRPRVLHAVFSRIDEKTLPPHEQERISGIIARIQRSARVENDEDRIVAHFMSLLIEMHLTQQEREASIHKLVSTCNNYLVSKRLFFNSTTFKITIHPAEEELRSSKHPLKLRHLSSGEKQIISLFSHIYLSGRSQYFILLDEPELSLSVTWQRRFLPDLLDSARCSGLIAVTHSPFIFDNNLRRYTHSLSTHAL